MNHFRYFIFCLIGLGLCSSSCEPNQQDDTAQIVYKNTDNVVNVRIAAEPDVLNPLLTTSGYSRYVYEQIFMPLLEINPQTLETAPGLAKGAPKVEDITEGAYAGGTAYTYELWEEARWDNGSPITGNDVAFTFKLIFNPKLATDAYRSYFDMVRDVRVDPDQPQKFTIYTVGKNFLSEDALSALEIYPAYHYDPDGVLQKYDLADLVDMDSARSLVEQDEQVTAFAEKFSSAAYGHDPDKVVGSGPYRLVEWKSGELIRLERKEDWWGDQLAEKHASFAAHPEGLTFRIIQNPATVITAIKDEVLDVTNAINAGDFVDLKSVKTVTDRYNLYTPAALQIYYVALNTKRDKLSDKRVRRALAHLLDVDAVINNLYQGLAVRTTVPFHPSKSYYNKDLSPIPFDIEKARSLLSEAGWEDTNGNGTVDKEISGKRTELELNFLTTSSSTFAQNLAVLMQENAKRAGVKIDISSKEFSAVKNDWVQRDFDMFSGGFGVFPTDMDPKQLWHTDSDVPTGGNRVGFGNTETDALIDEIRSTMDREKRKDLYKKLQEIIYEEQPMIFLFAPQERLVIHKRFQAEPTTLNPGYMPNEFKVVDVVPN